MKLFGLGKNKDDLVDERVSGPNLDDEKNNNIEDDTRNCTENDGRNCLEEENGKNVDDDTSDYIDPDDLNCDTYDDVLDNIEYNGWNRISSVTYPITTFDTQIVSSKQVKANCCDTVLEVICPQERIIAICGFDECGIDPDDFCATPNFYDVPHFFTLRCTDNNGVDIYPTTIISISKVLKDEEPEKCYQEFYGDLSPVIDGKLKQKENRYYFSETIVLQSGEKLIFKVNNPNIDISKVDLLMMSDLFQKDEDEDEDGE